MKRVWAARTAVSTSLKVAPVVVGVVADEVVVVVSGVDAVVDDDSTSAVEGVVDEVGSDSAPSSEHPPATRTTNAAIAAATTPRPCRWLPPRAIYIPAEADVEPMGKHPNSITSIRPDARIPEPMTDPQFIPTTKRPRLR